jgi:hypothetical protein
MERRASTFSMRLRATARRNGSIRCVEQPLRSVELNKTTAIQTPSAVILALAGMNVFAASAGKATA